MQFVTHQVAVDTYRASGERLPVELSAAARKYRARNLSMHGSSAGLAEVQAEFDFRPVPAFILAPLGLTNDDLLRDARKFARRVQLAKELHAKLIHN